MTEIAISRWIRKDRTSPTSHNYTWGTVIKCYSPHHTWTLEMKMTDDMKMAGGLKLDGLQGSFQLNPLYVSLSFHCQSLRCGQNWEWPNEINWKKKKQTNVKLIWKAEGSKCLQAALWVSWWHSVTNTWCTWLNSILIFDVNFTYLQYFE